MKTLMRLARRAAYWLRFRARQADLREEIAFHQEQLANDFQRQGLSPDDARVAARQALGNETYMREEARGVWLSFGADAVQQDCRYAWRSLRRSPGFTAVVVLTLALGIGANTAIFSVVHNLLLAPLPFPDGNRIVRLERVSSASPDIPFGVGSELLRQMEARSHTLEDFSSTRERRYQLGSEAQHDTVYGALMTPSFPTMLRVRPVVGRDFGPDDARVGAAPVMMIGYGLWRTRYAGAPDVLGKVVSVNGAPRVIVGVASIDMAVPMSDHEQPAIWLPMSGDSAGNVLARLRRRMTTADASREMQSMRSERADTAWRAQAVRAQDLINATEKRAIEMLFVAAVGLLLIACANIANLLLMRAWNRQRELAIRRALGANRWRIARHVLAESLMLAALGGGLGLLIAWRGLRAIVALRPGQLSDLDGVHIEPAVLLWTTAIAVTSGLLFGIAPALFSSGRTIGDTLRAGVRSAVGSSAAGRLRGGMVVAEVALSCVFLVAAGLLVRSFVALEGTSIGFDPAGLVTINVRFAHPPALADRDAIDRTLMQSIGATPGVSEATLGGFPGALLQTDVRMGPYAVEGPDGPRAVDLQMCETPFVGPRYFHVTRVPLLQGRGFDAADHADVSRELVVNQALARRLWPNGNALGAKLRVGDDARATWLTVVGVAGDLHLPGLAQGDLFKLQMYRPASEAGALVSNLVLRVVAGTSMATLQPALKRAVENSGLSATLQSMDPAESTFDRRVLARPRFALMLFGVFAIIALAVSAVGLYAIVAYAVTQRTREIGVRVALGAEPAAVARLILGASARLVCVGGCIGLLAAYAATRALTSFLYDMSPTDPFAFGGAVLLLSAVALIASFIPMRRALRVDPMEALRAD